MAVPKDEQREKARKFLRSFAPRDDWLVLDTETTGPDPEVDEVVEVAIVDAFGRTVLERLIQPKTSITEGAQEIHGIGPDRVANAPHMDVLRPTLGNILRHETVLIYNRGFDGPILENSFEKRGVAVSWKTWDLRCVMEAFAMGFGEWDEEYGSYSWVKLTEAASRRGIDTGDVAVHRAHGDAEITRRLVRSFEQQPEPAA